MDSDEFIRRLARLSAAEIAALATRLRALAGDDVAWWRATIAVDGSVRRRHRSTRSATAASAAQQAVAAAAARSGLDPAAPDVTLVAHAASDAARALVAEDRSVDPCYFLDAWDGVLRLPAWAPCTQRVAA